MLGENTEVIQKKIAALPYKRDLNEQLQNSNPVF